MSQKPRQAQNPVLQITFPPLPPPPPTSVSMAPQIKILFFNVYCMKSIKYRTFHIQIQEPLEMYDLFIEVIIRTRIIRKHVKFSNLNMKCLPAPKYFSTWQVMTMRGSRIGECQRRCWNIRMHNILVNVSSFETHDILCTLGAPATMRA